MEKYDIFISYASPDFEWAKKVNDSLVGNGFKVFFDQARLTAGRYWEVQLKDALLNSDHMVSLWSQNSRESDWVSKEMGFFDVYTSKMPDRKLITVVLNDEPKAYVSLQGIYDIKKKNLYDAGAESVPAELWEMLVQKIVTGINDTDASIPVQRAILTLTRDQVSSLSLDSKLPFLGPTFGQMLDQSQVTKEKLLEQYGEARDNWKPFGSDKPINLVLDELLSEINKKNQTKYKWAQIENDSLFTDLQRLNSLKERLKKEPAIIIVDPVAFYIEDIRDRFATLIECLENKNILVMAFSYFEPSPAQCSWRKLIEHGAQAFHKNYFDPPIPKNNYRGLFTANPLDRQDAGRFIKSMIAEIEGAVKVVQNPYTN